MRVLVPLCGKSVDLTWLENQGCEVLGIEFIEQAAREYFSERGCEPTVERQPALSLSAGGVTIVVGDFFSVGPKQPGLVDVIYDRAALVAIEPERREEYVATLARWLRPSGKLLLVSFSHDMGSGPPFSVPETEELLSPYFRLELVQDEDVLETEPRFSARGATYFRQRVFLGTLK